MPASSPSRRNYPAQMIARLKEMEAPERPKLCGPEYTAWKNDPCDGKHFEDPAHERFLQRHRERRRVS